MTRVVRLAGAWNRAVTVAPIAAAAVTGPFGATCKRPVTTDPIAAARSAGMDLIGVTAPFAEARNRPVTTGLIAAAPLARHGRGRRDRCGAVAEAWNGAVTRP
jgi:hypothetical protein